MKKTIIILLALTMVLCVFAGCEKREESQIIYRLYFGLNDATKGMQVIDEDAASLAIDKIITDSGYGFTRYDGFGGYLADSGVVTNETLIYEICFAEKEKVDAIVEKVKKDLNLASVLVVEAEADYVLK